MSLVRVYTTKCVLRQLPRARVPFHMPLISARSSRVTTLGQQLEQMLINSTHHQTCIQTPSSAGEKSREGLYLAWTSKVNSPWCYIMLTVLMLGIDRWVPTRGDTETSGRQDLPQEKLPQTVGRMCRATDLMLLHLYPQWRTSSTRKGTSWEEKLYPHPLLWIGLGSYV